VFVVISAPMSSSGFFAGVGLSPNVLPACVIDAPLAIVLNRETTAAEPGRKLAQNTQRTATRIVARRTNAAERRDIP